MNNNLSLKLRLRHETWMSLKKSYLSLKKKKGCQLSTRKSANKTTKYLNVFLMMRAHGVNWCFMPFKRVQLITSDSIPHLHRNELSVFHNAVQPHSYNERICQVKLNLNSLVLSTSYDAELSVRMWKAKITNLTDMSINLKKKKIMADTQLLTKGAERTSKYYISIITKN